MPEYDENDPFFDGQDDEDTDSTTGQVVSAETDPAETDPAETVQAADELSAEVQEQAAAEEAAKKAAEKEAAEEAGNKALEDFKEYADSLLTNDDRDKTTGELPVILVQGVLDRYTLLPGAKFKGLGKSHLESKMQDLMVEGSTRIEAFVDARTYMLLNAAVKAAKQPKTESVAKPKVDPTEAFAERIAAMLIAPNLVTVPENVKSEWADKAQALAAELDGAVVKYRDYLIKLAEPRAEGEEAPTAPDTSPIVLAAAKIAAGRVTGSTRKSAPKGDGSSVSAPRAAHDGPRGDIGKHIREAMDTVSVGAFMSIAEIAKFVSSEYGSDGKNPPSQGAIAARLFPGGDASACKLDFVQPEGKDEGHAAKGAVRTV